MKLPFLAEGEAFWLAHKLNIYGDLHVIEQPGDPRYALVAFELPPRFYSKSERRRPQGFLCHFDVDRPFYLEPIEEVRV